MIQPRPRTIPEATVARLAVYLRVLSALADGGRSTVSSGELAAAAGVNPAGLRKDLSHLGPCGVRGVGYEVSTLRDRISAVLGVERSRACVLVGIGNLGSALFHYKGFGRQGFRIAVVIDDDPGKIGREIDGVPVVAGRDMAREIKARGIQIAIVAVPPEAAQTVTEQLVTAGIKAVLNFAPTRLRVGREVRLKNVDLSIELEQATRVHRETTDRHLRDLREAMARTRHVQRRRTSGSVARSRSPCGPVQLTIRATSVSYTHLTLPTICSV